MENYESENEPEKEVLNLIDQYENIFFNQNTLFFEEEEFEQIIYYYEDKGHFEKALNATEIAIRQHPYSSEFLIRMGNALIALERYEESIEVLDKAQILDGSNVDIFMLKADALTLLNKYDEAIEEIEKGLASVSDESSIYLWLEKADIYEETDDFQKVYECLEKVLELQPENEEALNRIWFATELTEKYDDSFHLHKKLIDKNPYNYLAWYNYAQANFGLGLLEKAVDAFEYVIAINEDFELAYRDCGDALFLLGKYQEAIVQYKRVEELFKPYEELYFCIGLCYEKMKEFIKSRIYYRKATRINPAYDEAFFRIGETYRKEKRWANAASSYEIALRLKTDNVYYLTALGDANYFLDDMVKAIEYYKKSVVISSNIKSNWIKLAGFYFEIENLDMAIAVIEEASVKCSPLAEFGYYKAAYLFCKGERQQAIITLENALSVNFKKYRLLFKILPSLKKDVEVLGVIEQYK